LTNLKSESKLSPFDRVITPKTKTTDKRTSLIYLGAFALTLGSVFAANTWITIPDVEFGRGVANFPACIKYSVVDFDLEVTQARTTVSALDISNLGIDCEGKYLRVTLLGLSEEIIGQLNSLQLGTASTLRLAVDSLEINPASVYGVNFELSDRPF
jgi:hypothetical protein